MKEEAKLINNKLLYRFTLY